MDTQGLHHCSSQGIPSLSPSIFTLGQFFRKNLASLHELIWEQCLRPSQRYSLVAVLVVLEAVRDLVSVVLSSRSVRSLRAWAEGQGAC